jgi:urea transport system permease protein
MLQRMSQEFFKRKDVNKLGFTSRSLLRVCLILACSAVYVVIANQVFAESSAFHVSSYTVNLMGKYLCYALLALSLDLVWGYCGILSLGHGAFFALGGYAMGMYLMRQIGDRGVYGNPTLPDFMVFLDWESLPWFWFGSDNFMWMTLLVIAVPGLLAFVFGVMAFRSKVSGVYLSIMTQAMTYALMLSFFRNEMGFGGNNGLTDFKDILGFSLQSDLTRLVLFVITIFTLLLAYCACHKIVNCKVGKVILAIRDEESRVSFVGYNTANFKIFLFTFSAILAGIAGALYVPQVGIINPGEFSPINSIEIVIWVAIGGRGTLYGAIVGAVAVSYAKSQLTGIMPEAWLFALGGLFVLVTLLLPKGLVGVVNNPGSRQHFFSKFRRKPPESSENKS